VFAELLAHPGVREVVALRSRFGFLAFHGGSLEKGTDDIAMAAAEAAGASLYAVLQPPDLRWHLPSAEIDPAESPALRRFLGHVEEVVAIHGYGRPDRYTTILLGGTNRELARDLAGPIRQVLPEYTVVDEIDDIPRELRGLHPNNPVNRPPGGGVQLELPPRVRGLGPYWHDRRRRGSGPRPPHTQALIDALAQGARRRWPG
jgi:phage replication-related protein YjqB (UPF0714/DUF867 family)